MSCLLLSPSTRPRPACACAAQEATHEPVSCFAGALDSARLARREGRDAGSHRTQPSRRSQAGASRRRQLLRFLVGRGKYLL